MALNGVRIELGGDREIASLALAPEKTVRVNGAEPVELKQPRKSLPPAEKKPAADKTPAPVPKGQISEGATVKAAKPEASDDESSGSAEVVSLDAFRKKS